MAGVIVGSVISAGAGLLGSANSARASRDAANTQAEAARESGQLSYQISQQQLAAQKEALDKQIAASGATVDKQLVAQRDALNQQLEFQKMVYEQQRADFAPYRESGVANLNQLNTLLGIGGNAGAANYGRFATADFTNADFLANKDPGYGFRMSEGLKAVDRQAAARGGLISGNALKASQAYGQDMASQEYNNAFNRYQTVRGNTLQPFQTGAAAGQSAAAMQGQSTANYGSAGGQAIGQFGQGVSGAYGNQGQAANQAYGAYGQGTTGVLGAYGTNATNALTGGANAQASGIVGGANAFNQGLSGISNLANTYYVNSLLQGRNQANTIAGLNSTYGANNVYGAGAANYQPSIPTSGYFGSE
jgi:gas vesicle protein